MNVTFNKLKILITRPEHQAQTLLDEIEKLNGEPILFPTIVIAEIEDKTVLYVLIQRLNEFDMAIFISPNAVEKTACLLQEKKQQWPDQTKIIAVGGSTAKALHESGLPTAIFPEQGFNSEKLLALPELQAVAGKNILIFKGEGGRDLLTTTLRQRGAAVIEANVYRRILPAASLKDIDKLAVIICTSSMGLQNLYDMVDENNRLILLNKQLLVISERMVELARNLGFVKIPWVADNASDTAIIAALLRFLGEKTYGRSS